MSPKSTPIKLNNTSGITVSYTGEKEQEAEEKELIRKELIITLELIYLIQVRQLNST